MRSPELADAILALELERPFFLYAHLSSPHPPFLADENCAVGALPASRKSLASAREKPVWITTQLLAEIVNLSRLRTVALRGWERNFSPL